MFSSSLGLSGISILVFLGGWFLVSIPNQFTNRLGTWVDRINPFGFVPKWTFFAPIPGTVDYRLVYRDLLADGTAGEWKEVDWCPGRRWIDALWHPHRITVKLIVDSMNTLGQVVRDMRKSGIDVERDPLPLLLSTPYVVLLNLVMTMPRQDPAAVARQMAVFQQDSLAIRQQPAGSPRMGALVLCSGAHNLN